MTEKLIADEIADRESVEQSKIYIKKHVAEWKSKFCATLAQLDHYTKLQA